MNSKRLKCYSGVFTGGPIQAWGLRFWKAKAGGQPRSQEVTVNRICSTLWWEFIRLAAAYSVGAKLLQHKTHTRTHTHAHTWKTCRTERPSHFISSEVTRTPGGRQMEKGSKTPHKHTHERQFVSSSAFWPPLLKTKSLTIFSLQ